ncbi:ribose-phosphate pyrophosphokinase-like domain-containing protein [Bacillus mojavensis]
MIKIKGKEVKFETFPNGETRFSKESIHTEDFMGLALSTIRFKYEDDSDLIKLMFLKNYIDTHVKSAKVNLIIHYMPYSRMDRSEGQSPFTLKYVASFINSLNFNNVYVIEPHSDVTAALLDNVKPMFVNFDLIESVKKEVKFDEDKDYLMFPDAGAAKRYEKMKAKNILTGHKHRDFDTGRIEKLDLVGDVSNAEGRTAIIVDDLSSYGGTFIKSSEALRSAGFKKVYLLVAHAEDSVLKGDLFNHIDKLFTTDSIISEENIIEWHNAKYREQIKIFNLENLI